MRESLENDPWAELEAAVAADPTLQSFNAEDAGCAFDLAAVPQRIEVEAALDRLNLKGESWEWMGVRHVAFSHDNRRYSFEILAPVNQNFTLIDVIRENDLPLLTGTIDDDIVLAILATLPECHIASPCMHAETMTATVWYTTLEPKPDCGRSRFLAVRRSNI